MFAATHPLSPPFQIQLHSSPFSPLLSLLSSLSLPHSLARLLPPFLLPSFPPSLPSSLSPSLLPPSLPPSLYFLITFHSTYNWLTTVHSQHGLCMIPPSPPPSAFPQVIATEDINNQPRNGSTTVSIEVTNVNDNIPVFENTTYLSIIPENAPPGTFVTMVTMPFLFCSSKTMYL